MRAALVQGEDVLNVIEYDPKFSYDPGDGVNILELTDEPIGPGWRYVNGSFEPPPERSLHALPSEIPADGSSTATVTYKNTYSDAPDSVTFDVNGSTATATLSSGIAQIEITTSQPEKVLVTCDGLTVEITGV